MANENSDEKTKTTVPGMVRTAKGVAEHAAAVLAQQWDKDRKVFRDPITTMMALFTYAKLTAALLHETEERLVKQLTAAEKRLAEFETRLTTLERWKSEKDAEAALMVKGFEDMIAGGDGNGVKDQIKSFLESQPAGSPLASLLPSPLTEVPLIEAPAEKNGEHKDDVA